MTPLPFGVSLKTHPFLRAEASLTEMLEPLFWPGYRANKRTIEIRDREKFKDNNKDNINIWDTKQSEGRLNYIFELQPTSIGWTIVLGSVRLRWRGLSHCDLYQKYKPSPGIQRKLSWSYKKKFIKNSIESKALSRHQEEKLVKYGTRTMTREDWRSATNICYLLLTEPPQKTC